MNRKAKIIDRLKYRIRMKHYKKVSAEWLGIFNQITSEYKKINNL